MQSDKILPRFSKGKSFYSLKISFRIRHCNSITDCCRIWFHSLTFGCVNKSLLLNGIYPKVKCLSLIVDLRFSPRMSRWFVGVGLQQ